MSPKGKGKAIEQTIFDNQGDSVTQQDLDDLLDQCRKNAEKAEEAFQAKMKTQEEILTLDDDPGSDNELPLPPLDPGHLPQPYLDLDDNPKAGPSKPRHQPLDLAFADVPAPPVPPPELTKSGNPLTHKEKKALKHQTAGPNWFDMPAPRPEDLPHLHREVESLRLRNQLDPKRFYRKDEGDGKGIKGLPKFFAIGKMVTTDKPFGGASADNLPKSHRKRTMVDELIDDAEAKRYAKRKFNELQDVRGARGRNTLQAKKAMRQQKW